MDEPGDVFLALREIRRAKVRFALLTGAVALLAFLILFQVTLQDALIRGFVGGVRNQSAPVLVFDLDGRRTPQASNVSPEQRSTVEGVEGVAAVAGLWATTVPMRADGDTTATTVVGWERRDLGGPQRLVAGRWPSATDEVVANEADQDRGYDLGDRVRVVGGPELRIVGLAADVGINVIPTVFGSSDTYVDVLRSRNPDATLPPPNVLGVRPGDGESPETVAARIVRADDALDALERAAAADGNPGVQSIRQSFNVIFLLFALVVPLVTGLFFLILTFQKASSLTLLRAIGAPSRRLVGSLLVQVALVLGIGLALAVLLYLPLSSQRLNSLALRFETRAVLTWSGVLISLGVLSALASVRRVLAIDPIEATTGAGVRS